MILLHWNILQPLLFFIQPNWQHVRSNLVPDILKEKLLCMLVGIPRAMHLWSTTASTHATFPLRISNTNPCVIIINTVFVWSRKKQMEWKKTSCYSDLPFSVNRTSVTTLCFWTVLTFSFAGFCWMHSLNNLGEPFPFCFDFGRFCSLGVIFSI